MKILYGFLICLFFVQILIDGGKINVEQALALIGTGGLIFIVDRASNVDN